jgi:hypothetical protein
MWINSGAQDLNGQRIKTKRALKAALAADPSSVRFDATALNASGQIYRADELGFGDSLMVVGPDPYTSRKWYATVSRDLDGKIKVL